MRFDDFFWTTPKSKAPAGALKDQWKAAEKRHRQRSLLYGACGSQPAVRSAGGSGSEDATGYDVLVTFEPHTAADCALALIVHLATRPRVVSVGPAPRVEPKRRELLSANLDAATSDPGLVESAERGENSTNAGGNHGGSEEDEESEDEKSVRRQLAETWCDEGDSCFGQSCDYWVGEGYSCGQMEEEYGCECTGCTCTPFPAPATICPSPNTADTCLTLTMYDSYGDGWQGSTAYWVETGSWWGSILLRLPSTSYVP